MTEGFYTRKEKNSTEEIQDSLLVFGSDVLRTKFPSHIDGLKDVTRRIVWFSEKFKDITDLIRLISEVGEQHTGGDSSVYGAMIRLGQPFMVGHPLIEIHGKGGEYYAPGAAAAARYLQARLSDFARDIFFTGVNLKTIPLVPTKNFSSMEPRYLIPRLPTALLLGNLTVGFGFKSYVPPMDYTNICNLVMLFAEFYSNGGMGIPSHKEMAKYFVPAFPIRNLIKNKTELIRHYSEKDYTHPIAVDGWVDVTGNTITLRTVPYGVDFGTTTTAFRNLLKDKKHWLNNYVVTVNQFSAEESEVTIELKRGQNPFLLLERIKKLIKFSLSWTPIFNYIRNERAFNLNPATLTYLWYQERAISIASGLKYKQAELIRKRMTLEAMLVVAEHSKEVIRIIENSDTVDHAVDSLYRRFKELTWNQATIISQSKINILVKANKEQIHQDIEHTNVELTNTANDFTRINEIIYNDAQWLKKKYATTTQSVYSESFKGCVLIENMGLIQFFNDDDMYNILNTRMWPANSRKLIFKYRNDKSYYILKNNKMIPFMDKSREVLCSDFYVYPKKEYPYTLAIPKTGSCCIIGKQAHTLVNQCTLCPITEDFYAIKRNGTITETSVKSFAIRKSVTKGAISDIIYGLPKESKDIIFITACTGELNTIRLQRILREDGIGKVILPAVGEVFILAAVPINTDNEIYLSLPLSCCKNLVIEQLVITNLSSIFERYKKNSFYIPLTKNLKNPFTIATKRSKIIKTMFHLDMRDVKL